jgi:hypothetical protein
VLNAASGTLVDDLLSSFFQKIKEEQKAVMMKMGVAVIAISGAIIASFYENMIVLMLKAY